MTRTDHLDLPLDDDPLWYKDAVIYELHIRSFFDSNDDGIGDIRGVTRKLDYLEELGVTAVWVLPFYPSPLRDDGYDIADYRQVNPDYGTLRQFRTFLREAHRRGIRVITELVINHTSDQHPWFQKARRAEPGSRYRDYYVWSDDPEKYSETRIIFKDFEPSNWTWDPVAGAYYWHRFYHHQPDLNFDNPEVHQELLRILDFWLEMGVDGLRLDAIPYLYEREGTNCENLPETHDFLKKLRAHVDEKFSNRMLLAEANQWPEDAAEYFGDGDECHMNFHFPLMPRLFMAVRMEDRFPIVDILEQTPEIPENCQWGLFLRNHDELTLEMVTDEERDYMYRVYADDPTARINLGIRRRLAPLLDNNRRKIELLNSLLLSLPGTPILYYGDEIQMGDNFYLGDRNGVRTPMQWSGDRNGGFSKANPQKLFLPVIIDPEYHYESVNVEAQHRNPSSLLWWMRRVIGLRQQHKAFGRGTFQWVEHGNAKVIAFIREYEGESILVVANLSRFAQSVALDLEDHSGSRPLELFGRNHFPEVTSGERYPMTLAPHGFFWFVLESEEAARDRIQERVAGGRSPEELPELRPKERWAEVLEGRRRARLADRLVEYLRRQRWFAGKGREVAGGRVEEAIPISYDGRRARLVLFRIQYVGDDPEVYLVPLAYASGHEAERIKEESPEAVVCRVSMSQESGILHDAVMDPSFCMALLDMVAGRKESEGEVDVLAGEARRTKKELTGGDADTLRPVPGRAEQSNTSIRFGDRWIFKLFRRIEAGRNQDLEVGEFLDEAGFEHSPAVAGALTLRRDERERATAGIVHTFVPNQGDAWEHTLDALVAYFEEALASEVDPESLPMPGPLLDAATADKEVPEAVRRAIGPYLGSARLLGQRTGDLHRTLASRPDLEAFSPEPFSSLYQRSLYQSMRNHLGTTLERAGRRLEELGQEERDMARKVLDLRAGMGERFQKLLDRKLDGVRIRCHGDYHLGQVLFTGKDFQIIDFEGEPDRPMSERRLKRSPLRDVAGMIRSFDYAGRTALRALPDLGLARDPRDPVVLPWRRLWAGWVSVEFLAGYLQSVEGAGLLPEDVEGQRLLLDLFVLEKALYELGYELNNRPAWARVPLEGILSLMEWGSPVSV